MNRKFLHLLISFVLICGQSFAAISTQPVTSNATEAAKKLYTFLYENYGTKTVSGIMTGDNSSASTLADQADVKKVLELDGDIYPALIGFDFLMTTGKNQDEAWFKGYSNNCISMAKELWKKGGIPAFCWHWKDPSKHSDRYEPDSISSYWNFTNAFVSGTTEWNTSSDEYKYMIEDINRVSDKLLELQEAGVAVLWRPLHEAAGQWFWWSRGTAEQYVALYRLMYDQMVNVKGVKNCIWVWNIERSKSLCQSLNDWTSPATLDGQNWYPGDAYVDIIGVDIYTRSSNTSGKDYFDKIQELMGTDKMISLSETDYIPDINNMVSDNAMWSYWMPWDNSWSSMFVKTSNSVWASNMSDARVITLDDMEDWGTYVGQEEEEEVSDPCTDLQNDLRKEAECADYVGLVVANDAMSGKKGINCNDENQSYINFTFNVPQSGSYKVIVGLIGLYGEKGVSVKVDGSSVGITAAEGSETVEYTAGTFNFKAGENVVTVCPGWSWFVVDYCRLEVDEEASKPVVPSSSLVTPNPSAGAVELYNFLVANWGTKTVSGFMLGSMDGVTTSSEVTSHEDAQTVYTRSGKYPALIGFDFMNATGQKENDSYYLDYTNKCVALAKDLWKKGGIPAFTWHWRDPSRETEQFYAKDKNHENGTTFKISNAMNSDMTWNTSSTAYANLISDIDKIADYFLDLQSQGIAAIFRPLHEASGAWFWWGTEGGDYCASLYRLIYDEMVRVKNVKNLIWVWNPEYATDADWNPGDAYYDVISIDIYNSAYDYQSNYVAYNNLKGLSNSSKLIALSENGPLPDVDDCFDNNATWSWWMPWYQSWNGLFADQTSNEEWTKVMTDERIITLDEMPGWESGLSTKEIPADNVVYPTYINQGFTVNVSDASTIMVSTISGDIVYQTVANGPLFINSQSWANGIYLLTLNGQTYKLVK